MDFCHFSAESPAGRNVLNFILLFNNNRGARTNLFENWISSHFVHNVCRFIPADGIHLQREQSGRQEPARHEKDQRQQQVLHPIQREAKVPSKVGCQRIDVFSGICVIGSKMLEGLELFQTP